MTHVLLVGAGAIAERVHLPFLAAEPIVDRLSIADRDRPEVAERLARDYGAGTYAADIERSDADWVWICTPPGSHAELAIRALGSGKDVVIEKPLALRAADAVAVTEAALRHGRRVYVCHTARYRPDTSLLNALAADGRLGRLLQINASWVRHNGIPSTAGASTDGVLWDLGSHLIDLAVGIVGMHLTGVATGLTHRPVPASSAIASWYPATGPARESEVIMAAFAGMITLDEGPTISVTAAWDAPTARDAVVVEVAGSMAHMHMRTLFGFSPDRATMLGPSLEITDVHTGQRQVLLAEQLTEPMEYRTQLRDVFTGRPSWRADLDRSVATVRLCEALAESIRLGAPVAFNTLAKGAGVDE